MDNETIRTLNSIRINDKLGLYKGWVLKEEKSELIGDILQKMSFSICDLNKEINNYSFSPKSIIYQIVLGTWILESVDCLKACYKPDVLKSFVYDGTDEFEKAKNYIRLIRSFVVAHPLTTNRHPKEGLDGDFVCVDIFNKDDKVLYFIKSERTFFFGLNGITSIDDNKNEVDYYLKVYSNKVDGFRFFCLIGCSFKDLYNCLNLLINYVYSLDNYLSKQKKRDYIQ